MKAIILAGGEGTRLRPLSLNKPKPMLRLFDRPLLEHIVLLLKKSGFTELCMTLHYLPEVIRDHFGDGSDFGLSIEYRTEAQPAGTAGGVLACSDFVGDEDFLVISGDAACSYDLRVMMEKHRLSGADATLLVRQSEQASDFGLVLTEENGCVRGFVEKPGPERVVSDLINTGIYALSPSVLREIPKGRSADFGGEVFPGMLRNKKRLHVWQAEGYWNDVGSCSAFLATCRDVLNGRFPLELPAGSVLSAPGGCWVSPEARVAPGAQLGPMTVIGAGSAVADGCRVSGSVLDGASLQPGCEVRGAVLAPGVCLGREVQLRPGCVLGEGVTVGDGSLLREGVRIWPGLTLPAGRVISEDMRCCAETAPLHFRSGGVLSGGVRELTPERLMRLGSSCTSLRVGAAASGGSYARLQAEAFLLGAGAGGSRVFLTDAPFAAACAAVSGVYDLDISLFVRQTGTGAELRFFDRDGLPLPRAEQRKLEAALGGTCTPAGDKAHSPELLTGAEEAYISDALSSCCSLRGLRLACSDGILREGFRRAGAELSPPESGLAELRLSEDGFTLEAADETGRLWPWSMLLCAMTAAELRSGEQAVVLPYDAPELAERIAQEENGTIYRLDRDGEDARRLLRQAPWCRDGLTLALRLFSRLKHLSLKPELAPFMRSLPEYHAQEQVLKLDGPDTTVLRLLSGDRDAETVSGVRLRRGDCTATIRRLGGGELRILTESFSMEAAAEFAESLRRRIRRLDAEGND